MDDFISKVSLIGIPGLQDEWQSDSPPIPEEVQIDDSPIYGIERQLGRGGNGLVFVPVEPSVLRLQVVKLVAVKFQGKHPGGSEADIPHEREVYDEFGKNHGIPLPRVHCRGQQGDYNILVMDLLGPGLHVQLIENHPSMPLAAVACVAVEAISILEKLHSRGYIHGDIRPENFLLGPPGTPDERKLFLIDLGLAVRWQHHSSGSHVRYHQSPNQFRGTPHFASLHAHHGRTSSRRDDLESLAYMLAFLIRSHLPWLGFEAEDSVRKRKMATPVKALCRSCPPPFLQFDEFAVNLRFDEDPNYARYISLFHGIIGENPYVWPVNADAAREGLKTPGNLIVSPNTFPYTWIKRKWALGTYVTAMATVGSSWVAVMSSAAGFVHQVVELDFQYPFEGNLRKVESRLLHHFGCRATPAQVAFVFSIPEEEEEVPVRGSQDALQTSLIKYQ